MEKIRSAGWQVACTPLEDFILKATGAISHLRVEKGHHLVLRRSLVLKHVCFGASVAKQKLVRSCHIGSGVRDRGG